MTVHGGTWIKQVKLVDDHHEKVDVPLDLEMKVLDFQIYRHNNGSPLPKPYKISQGLLFSETITNHLPNWIEPIEIAQGSDSLDNRTSFREKGELAVYDLETEVNIFFELRGYPSTPWNPSHLIDKDMLIEYSNGNIYTIKL